jgi:hypothetical protein
LANISSVNQAAQALGFAAASQVHKGAGAASPSKLTYYTGQMIGAGLINGMKSTHAAVTSTAKHLGTAVVKAVAAGVTAAGGMTASAISTLASNIQTQASALISNFQGLSTTISQGIAGQMGIGQLSQDSTGQTSLQALKANLDARIMAAKKFADDLKTVRANGGSQDLISQLAGMGSTNGDQLAQQLNSGGASAVTSLQSQLTNLTTVAQTGGDTLAKSYYGSGANSMQQYIAGLMAGSPALTTALQSIQQQVQAVFGVSPTLHTVVPPATAAPSAGATHVTVHVAGTVISAQSLATTVRTALLQTKARTGALGLA